MDEEYRALTASPVLTREQIKKEGYGKQYSDHRDRYEAAVKKTQQSVLNWTWSAVPDGKSLAFKMNCLMDQGSPNKEAEALIKKFNDEWDALESKWIVEGIVSPFGNMDHCVYRELKERTRACFGFG